MSGSPGVTQAHWSAAQYAPIMCLQTLFRRCLRSAFIAGAVAAQLLSPTFAASPRHAGAGLAEQTLEDCHWDRPGVDPFMGNVVEAVDAYRDIPAEVRERLKARMAKRQYDDLVSIRRDSISGRDNYGATIWDMHFGTRKICKHVTREGWTEKTEERGLVYCEGGQCILVPTVCRNVSRITRSAVADESAEEPLLAMIPAPFPAAASPALPLAASDGVTAFALNDGMLSTGGDASSFATATGLTTDEGGSGTSWFAGSGPGPGPGSGAAASPPGSTLPAAPVPEPETWALLLFGLAFAPARLRAARHAKRQHRLHPR